MLRILFLLALIQNVQNVRTCKWVCVDKNNQIKKEFISGKKVSLDYQRDQEISVTVKEPIKKSKKIDVTLKNPEFLVEPQQDMCQTKESYKTIQQMAKKIKCRPRETIINIKYKDKRVIPNKVTTKLCSGFCTGSKSCMFVERKNVSLSVSIPDSGGRLQCSVVSIPRDIKCKCDCDKKAFGCSPKQIFDKQFCKCKCNNEEEFKSCVSKMGNDPNKYYWNKHECLCKCKNEYICSTGSNWNHNQCKCVRHKKQ